MSEEKKVENLDQIKTPETESNHMSDQGSTNEDAKEAPITSTEIDEPNKKDTNEPTTYDEPEEVDKSKEPSIDVEGKEALESPSLSEKGTSKGENDEFDFIGDIYDSEEIEPSKTVENVEPTEAPVVTEAKDNGNVTENEDADKLFDVPLVAVEDQNETSEQGLNVPEEIESEAKDIIAETPLSPPLPPRSPNTMRAALSSDLAQTIVKPKYNVPPALADEMKTENFRKNVAIISSKSPKSRRVMSPIDSAADINLIANRYRVTSHLLDGETVSKRENIEEGQVLLKSNYTTILEQEKEETSAESTEATIDIEDEETKEFTKINWKFWTSVVNDFALIANKESYKLEAEISRGIPRQIRGIIWQLIANSKSKEFEDIFLTLLDTESIHEATITRDLKRTNFIPKDKVDALFNVMKVYSVYDPDVGYTQGMGFITTPLLLNCDTEAAAFGLLIILMKNYGLRDFFLPEMPGLMLLLYQFDRVLEENSPVLYNHLNREGIRSSMYATQWFLTFFAYKFPLEFVLRIYDVIFFEGIESILKFAVNLMLKNKDEIITLKFDRLLDFLKNELFEYYSKDTIVERRKQVADGKPALRKTPTDVSATSNSVDRKITNDHEYDVDLFVKEAMNEVHITPISLHRYAEEYKEIHQIQHEKEVEYDLFRIKNKQLERESKKLNHEYAILNKEHISIANELIENRLKTETLFDENNDLKETLVHLHEHIQDEKEKGMIPNPDSALPINLKRDLERTMERNTEVKDDNLKLQERIIQLELEVKSLKGINKASVHNQQQATLEIPGSDETPPASVSPSLSGGWTGFKKVFKRE